MHETHIVVINQLSITGGGEKEALTVVRWISRKKNPGNFDQHAQGKEKIILAFERRRPQCGGPISPKRKKQKKKGDNRKWRGAGWVKE